MKAENIGKSLKIRSKTAPSRIVYQPTESNNCEKNGMPTEITFKKYEEIAAGAPGILHIESIDVTPETQARSNRMVLIDETLSGYKELVERIRKINKEALIIFQLSHAGRLSDPAFKAPVAIYQRGTAPIKVLTTEEIQEARDQFVSCAVLAWKAGADGVDFKQAHGFLGDDFLHPANNRKDQYGGNFENRTRFFLEAYRAMRKEIRDPDFLIGSRISPFEGIPGGCGTADKDGLVEDLTEMRKFVKIMEAEGIDFINVSAGYAAANLELLLPSDQYPEGVPRLFGWTRMIKDEVTIPVIGSGYSYLKEGTNNLYGEDKEKKSLLYHAENNIEKGWVDFIGIGRQAIADPHFAKKLLENRQDEIKWCTTCGGCGALLGNNKPIGCTVYEREFTRILESVS
ncbi:MAG: NADH:flavin oxidoreductase [Spirochaetales bacterium]|nr:NADH:flavin oxidoreductase [Spirochaetales bacterium]